jgi:hypothetical protein
MAWRDTPLAEPATLRAVMAAETATKDIFLIQRNVNYELGRQVWHNDNAKAVQKDRNAAFVLEPEFRPDWPSGQFLELYGCFVFHG